MGRLFGTDGIRGKANQYPLDPLTILRAGQAMACFFSLPGKQGRFVIGKDTRASGDMVESALTAGMTAMGLNVLHAGVVPTPAVAYLTRSIGTDAGIVISASHNPYEDNGIKVFSREGYKLSEPEEGTLEALIFRQDLPGRPAPPEAIGRSNCMEEASPLYMSFLKSLFPQALTLKGMKMVLDTAHGATCGIAPQVFSDLGAEVEVMGNAPDGFNINKAFGSQHPEALMGRVKTCGADLGLAFDGDGDRVVAVDEKGEKLAGDQLLLICAKDLKEQGRLRNDILVSTVMSNLGLARACRRYGIRHHTSRVGDRHVVEDMRRLGAMIGGEDSGHVVFLEHHTTGDGILTGLELAASMVRQGKPLSELRTLMEIYPQRLMNVHVTSKPDLSTLPVVKEAIQEAEAGLKDQGRVLVRYSGTEDLCRVMVEGPSQEITQKYCEQIVRAVEESIS